MKRKPQSNISEETPQIFWVSKNLILTIDDIPDEVFSNYLGLDTEILLHPLRFVSKRWRKIAHQIGSSLKLTWEPLVKSSGPMVGSSWVFITKCLEYSSNLTYFKWNWKIYQPDDSKLMVKLRVMRALLFPGVKNFFTEALNRNCFDIVKWMLYRYHKIYNINKDQNDSNFCFISHETDPLKTMNLFPTDCIHLKFNKSSLKPPKCSDNSRKCCNGNTLLCRTDPVPSESTLLGYLISKSISTNKVPFFKWILHEYPPAVGHDSVYDQWDDWKEVMEKDHVEILEETTVKWYHFENVFLNLMVKLVDIAIAFGSDKVLKWFKVNFSEKIKNNMVTISKIQSYFHTYDEEDTDDVVAHLNPNDDTGKFNHNNIILIETSSSETSEDDDTTTSEDDSYDDDEEFEIGNEPVDITVDDNDVEIDENYTSSDDDEDFDDEEDDDYDNN